jgi:hypothetical protein
MAQEIKKLIRRVVCNYRIRCRLGEMKVIMAHSRSSAYCQNKRRRTMSGRSLSKSRHQEAHRRVRDHRPRAAEPPCCATQSVGVGGFGKGMALEARMPRGISVRPFSDIVRPSNSQCDQQGFVEAYLGGQNRGQEPWEPFKFCSNSLGPVGKGVPGVCRPQGLARADTRSSITLR